MMYDKYFMFSKEYELIKLTVSIMNRLCPTKYNVYVVLVWESVYLMEMEFSLV